MRRIVACLVAVPVILFASCFTISTLHPKHLVIMLPFTAVVVAAALGIAWGDRARPRSGVALVVLAALCIGQFGWDIRNSMLYHRTLAATGGLGLFSSAHNELADYLLDNGVERPLAADWGFLDNLTVLSGGRIAVQQIFQTTEPPPYQFTRDQVRGTLHDPSSVYIFHDESATATPGRLEAFLDVAEQTGADLQHAATFADRRGSPVIHVYRPASPDD
jgi:hypothetical protein